MQISDIPSDLEPPTAAFLPVLSLVLAEDASSRPLPTEMVASSLLMRHRFLNLTPEDSRYFQSRTDQDLSNALESLRGLAGQWQLSAWSWRASPSEVGGISLFTKVVVSPEDPRLAASMDGVGLVLSLEPAATALNPTTAPEEDQRTLKWKYYDAVPPISFEPWFDALEKALDDLPPKYRDAQASSEGLDDEGQIDAPEMSAEDFWEGAHSDSSGSSMIDDLEASTREFNLRSSLQTSLDSIGSPSEQQSKTASSLPPSPHATTFPPSIVLSPPSNQPEALPSVSGQYSDTAASSGSGTLRKRGSTISLLSGMSSSPVVAEALANSHVDPQEIRALKASLKGMLDLWTSSSSHQSLDSRLSRLQVFEAVADRVVVDHEQGIHDPED